LGVFGAGKAVTGETGQAVAAASGAFAGSIIPGVGSAGGALIGQRTMQGFNSVMKLGGLGSRPTRNDPNNPVSKFLQKISGSSISKSLRRDSRDPDSISPNEKKKRELVGDYAKKLQGIKNKKPVDGFSSKGTRTV
jgi:hypothetical protein